MARLCTLASGSSGNSTYISGTDGDILVDIGISYKSLLAAIDCAGGSLLNLKAVAITHGHIDHIKGLKVFLKNIKVPLIASGETLDYLSKSNFLPEGTRVIACDSTPIDLGGLSVTYFETSHDADGSGGYVITLPDGRRAAVCTDLGIMTDSIRSKLMGCEAILLESNHDIEMLRRGPYPPHLKLRILSDEGHLSNGACAAELPALLVGGTTRFILGHLSVQNNTPALALNAAKTSFAGVGAKIGEDCLLEVAKPKGVGVTVF